MKKLSIACYFCGKLFDRYESVLKKKKTKYSFCSYVCFQADKCSKTKNQDFFEKITDEGSAYWLGFLYADGNISKEARKQKCVSLEIAKEDKKHLHKYASIFGKKCSYSKRLHNGRINESCKCLITSKKMWQDLYDKNLFPNKTYIDSDLIFDHIPPEIMSNFVRGFFDGDGGISINKKTKQALIHFTSKRSKFLYKMKENIRQDVPLGDVKMIHRTAFNKNNGNYEDTYVLAWSGINQVIRIYDYFYNNATIYLDRKKKSILGFIKDKKLDPYFIKNDKWKK